MDVRGILSNLNIPAAPVGHRHTRAGWVNIDCPWCGQGTNKYHLGINAANLKTSCWRCGPHRLATALSMITGRPDKEFRHLWRDIDPVRWEEKQRLGKLKLPPGLCDLMSAHKEYLRRRGFNPNEIATRWGVKGTGPLGKLAWRLWIPLHRHGNVVSWTTRAINDNAQPRYRNAPPDEEAYPSGSILYGTEHARHAILITEGPTDVWAFGPGAVCTLGLQFSPVQVEEMLKYPIRAVCFDNEPKAQARARYLAGILKDFPGSTMQIEIESGDDLATADRGELREIRQELAI